MIFDHDEKEIELDINMSRYYPMTRHSPEEQPEMEIVGATYWFDGKSVDEELFEHLAEEHHDEIFQQFVDESQADRDDYEIERYDDTDRGR